jgi:hypothetical protein
MTTPTPLPAAQPEPPAPAAETGGTLTPLRAVQAETEAEQHVTDDGSVVVELVTDYGKADIRVPPIRKWRSIAKNALYMRDDDLSWAAQTLSPADTQEWIGLNPTGEDTAAFFERWANMTGQALGEALAARRR